MPLADRGPQAERTIDMNPRLGSVRDPAGRLEGIEHAGVEVACLQAHDRRRAFAFAQPLLERAHLDPARIVGLHVNDGVGADAEQARERRIDSWRFSVVRMRSGGAPDRPLASTSQPRSRSSLWRAEASAVVCAI